MRTLQHFRDNPPESLSIVTAYALSDLAEAKGRQELYTRQSPQRLKNLRENALIESAISSNRIEGVEVEHARIGTLIHGAPALRDREEAEVRGYKDALNLIHSEATALPISEDTTLRLHSLCRGETWDAGQYKERDIDIIENYPDGRSRVRFSPVPASKTPPAMRELFALWGRGSRESWVPPLILVAAMNLDFLCIHPFRDGNGRVSRLMLLQGLYHCGFEVGRYISVERLIEQEKERYYETLELSSAGWHEGRHSPWPYINFLLYVFNRACKELEERVGRLTAPRGEKSALVKAAIMRRTAPFSVAELAQDCPGVSVDTIRQVLKKLRGTTVECLGRGQQARWKRIN